MTVNKVILLGNLGGDPELRSSDSNQPICIFALATDSRRNSQTTEWHRIVCFGKLAETCAKYLQKGREVFVEGEIQTRRWHDKEGIERISNQILANSVQFVGDHSEEPPDISIPDNYIPYDGEEELPYNG